MKNILSLQNKLTPDDFAPLDENYFKEESLETEEIGYWKASWIRLKSNKIAMVAITMVVCILLAALVIQGNALQTKIEENDRRKAEVEQQLEEEEARPKEIEDLQDYVKSDEYMEKVAKEKIGLLKPN